MALNERLEPLINIVTSFLLDGGRDLTDQYGDQAPSLAEEVADMLEERLGEDSPFSQLWLEYREDPLPNEAELIGALEVMEEANPELTIRMEGYYAAFEELAQPGVQTLYETSEPEDTIHIEEIDDVKSISDQDNDDEYREENAYLLGNVEDRSTSAMYYEGLDTSIEPNQSETGETGPNQTEE